MDPALMRHQTGVLLMRLSLATAAVAASFALVSAVQAERLTDQPLVDTGWLAANLDHESLVVLDIRDNSQDTNFYEQGHVPGALFAPYAAYGWRAEVNGVPGMLPPIEVIEERIAALGIDNDDHVVIVPHGSDSSDFASATRVYWTFKVLGHDGVSILDGGWRAWSEDGARVSTEVATASPGSFTAEFRPELLATADDVAAAEAAGIKLVDARPHAQFTGEVKPPVAQTAGTIPGAVNIDQATLYDEQAGSFVSPERIAELAGAQGVGATDETIAFCNTGHWASIAWFALSEVGGHENVTMYDGSMAEWTLDPSRPVL
jgi:thiosulfate/3-mercaptopyruvate sulfurtransferase